MNEIKHFFEGFSFEFYPNSDSSKLIVFLPAVRSKDIYPYYPRISWGKELSEKSNILYIADPYQHLPEYQEPMGSWFVSPEGKFVLPELARNIESFALEQGIKEILFYGSSMGGFAAVVLASLTEGSKAIAECPQLILDKHPGSNFILNNFVTERDKEYFGVFPYIINSKARSIKLICSYYDRHYFNHIVPFFNYLVDLKLDLRTVISFYGFMDSSYNHGHVPLSKSDAFCHILQEIE